MIVSKIVTGDTLHECLAEAVAMIPYLAKWTRVDGRRFNGRWMVSVSWNVME